MTLSLWTTTFAELINDDKVANLVVTSVHHCGLDHQWYDLWATCGLLFTNLGISHFGIKQWWYQSPGRAEY